MTAKNRQEVLQNRLGPEIQELKKIFKLLYFRR